MKVLQYMTLLTGPSAGGTQHSTLSILILSGDGWTEQFRPTPLSWGRVNSGQGPLRPHSGLFAPRDPGSPSQPSLSLRPPTSCAIDSDDDPFVSPTYMDRLLVSTLQRGAPPQTYSLWNTIKSISKSLRRIFINVVNLPAPASKMKFKFTWRATTVG